MSTNKQRQRKNARARERRRTDPEFAARERESRLKHRDANRERLNAERRERIENDPDFKLHLDRLHADWRERVRNGHVPKLPPLYLEIDGTEQRVYRIAELCRLVGVSEFIFWRWRRGGWIPPSIHHYRGRAVYTRTQADFVGWFHSQSKHDHDARSRISKLMYENWKTIF